MVAHFPDFILIIKQNISVNSQKTDLKKKKNLLQQMMKKEKNACCIMNGGLYQLEKLENVGKCS